MVIEETVVQGVTILAHGYLGLCSSSSNTLTSCPAVCEWFVIPSAAEVSLYL